MDKTPHDNSSAPGRFAITTVAVCVAFLLTGVATALLGASLPVLLSEWRLSDRSGGLLLLLAWGGSTCGALLCRGRLAISAATGLAVTAIAMLTVAAVHGKAALPAFAFYGLGLGIAMTAITLLSTRLAPEASHSSILMRLNLLWSLGACIAPTLTTHALLFTRASGLFAVTGAAFALGSGVVLLRARNAQATMAGDSVPSLTALPAAPLSLFAMAALAVGVESAIGGWLATYSGRTSHTTLVTISASSAFWAGLLLSRALHSMKTLRALHSALALTVHAMLTLVATAGLLVAPDAVTFLPSALLAGFGLGPLYPRVLARVIRNYRPRAIFIVAGMGSAVLPWMTGAVSQAAGSLRAGLMMPCVGAVALLWLMLPRRGSMPGE